MNEQVETFGILYMVVYITSSVIAVLFSCFMMYAMWRTNRTVTRAAKNITDMADNLNKGLPIILDTLTQKNNLSPVEYPALEALPQKVFLCYYLDEKKNVYSKHFKDVRELHKEYPMAQYRDENEEVVFFATMEAQEEMRKSIRIGL